MTAQGRLVPLVASKEPEPTAVAPFKVSNEPATITREPSGVNCNASTVSSAVGAQPSNAPVLALNAANRVRDTPFAVPNTPPAYTVEFVTVNAFTVASNVGANDEISAPVDVLYAANRYLF